MRLDQLLGRLKSGDACTAASPQQELGISNTYFDADLDDLKEQGIPLLKRIRAGAVGYVYIRWGIGRIALNYREVIDLLLS